MAAAGSSTTRASATGTMNTASEAAEYAGIAVCQKPASRAKLQSTMEEALEHRS